MKVSELLATTTNIVPHVLLVTLPIIHGFEGVGHASIFAAVPNLQTEEVRELVIEVEVEPSSECDDERYGISHKFNLDLKAHQSIESLQQAVLIELQHGLIASAYSCGSISDDLISLHGAWDKLLPLEYEAPIGFHVFDIANDSANTVSQHLNTFHAIAHK